MATTALTPEIRRGRNQLAATVVLGHTVKHIYNSGLNSIILATMKKDLGLTGAEFGLLTTSGRITSGATTMVAGYLGDRFANRSGLMLLISLTMMGVSFYLLGEAPNYWTLFAVMLLVGIGPSLYHSPAIASLSRKFPDRRGFAISLHGTGGSIGEVVGPVMVGALITGTYFVAFEWREVLRISVLPALFFAVAIYLMMRNIPAAAADIGSLREYFSSLGTLLRRSAMISLVFITALRSVGQSAVMAFLPVYLLEDLGYQQVTIGFFMSSAQIIGIVAQPIMGWASDRYGRKIVLVPTTAALGLFIILLRFAPDVGGLIGFDSMDIAGFSVTPEGAALYIVVLAAGAFLYSLHTIYIAAAMDVARGQAQSTVVSLIYGASFLGAFSPWVAGVIVDAFGTPSAFIYGGVMVILGAALLAATRLPRTSTQEMAG